MLLTTVCNLSFSCRDLSAQIQERSSSPGTSCRVWKSTLVEQNLVSLILTLKPKLGLSLCHACRNSSHDRIVWLQKISIPTPPPPPHGRSLEIPRGRGGSKAVISKGVRGGHGKLFSKGWWTTYKTLKATYNRSEAQKHTYVRCFETKVSNHGRWDEVNIISFNVSVFLWVS